MYSRPVTDEDHVCQITGATGGQNCDMHLTFPGLRLQRSYQVSPRDITTEVLHHGYLALLCFAALGNYTMSLQKAFLLWFIFEVCAVVSHGTKSVYKMI